MTESIFAKVEFKFADDGEPGVFTGYGAVFNNTDSHGDVILPGAFAKSLAKHAGAGTMPGMYLEHSQFVGNGTALPAGRWLAMHEDHAGLHVKGKISALDTDRGKMVRGLMQDGAMPGLSIAYTVPPGGAERSKAGDATKRRLSQIDLAAVDIVAQPSNPRALVHSVKSVPEFSSIRALENWLHESGLSIGAARRVAAGGFPNLKTQNDDDAAARALLDEIRTARTEIQTMKVR